ncbi:major facilitator superfamily domain-containing protein [Mortierella sp. GBAus27b]|nr:major facilitator superfamily domain-containing protein [Mortierella sp. GBAus27b]
MSELSYERGYRDHEKQDGYNTYGYGYQGGVFRPDAETEAKIVSKLDRNLLPLLGILYLFSYLDRVNIGNARLFGLEEDVKLSNGEYNIALAAFFLSYCIFEMPSNMILIRVGPRLWIPVIMFAWGTVSLGLAWITSFKGLVIMRFALGAAEAGFVPGVLFYLTLFYKRSEHSFRMAIFLCFNILAGAFGGLLAAGISHLQGKWGLQRWQWIFVLEAIPTILLAFLTWFIMSPSPEEARFLTPEERSYAANRVLADTDIRPSPESSWKQTVAALTDVHVYLICLCTFFLHAASSGVIMFMPSLILDMGFKATTAQLLTTPPYIVAAGVSLFIPWWSDRLQVRGLFVIFVPVIAFLGFILLALTYPTTLHLSPVKYLAVIMALCGMVPMSAILTSWLTNNVIGHTKRATSLAMMVSSGALASMLGTQVYRSEDAPRYQHGHLMMAGCMLFLILGAIMLRTLFLRENRRRDKGLSKGLTLVQFKSDGQFSEIGDHPNFRFTI